MSLRLKTIIFLLFSGLWACEEVIDIDLNTADPALVIEGIITDEAESAIVRISRTTGFFNPSDPPAVAGANVTISPQPGSILLLQEVIPGVYIAPGSTAQTGKNYSLEVEIDGERYTGSSYMPEKIAIDSLVPEYYPGGRFSGPVTFVRCFFTDPAGEKNYYRIRMYKNNMQSAFYYLLDDRFSDGLPVNFFLFGEAFQPGDTAVVELLSIDFASFDYFSTLSEVVGTTQQGFGSTPANPNSNLSPGALGYFSAMAVARDTLIIQ